MTEAAPAGVEIDDIIEAAPGYFGFDDDPDALGFGVGTWARTL